MQKYRKHILSRLLIWILISFSTLSLAAICCLLLYRHQNGLKEKDSKYNIIALVQVGSQREGLKSLYLAELLDLSVDKPQNLYTLSVREAQKKLEESPLIKKARVNKVSPGTLFIDYEVRQPMAYLGDFSNTAIDAEGVLIPFKPFFLPKHLPTIILGEDYFEGVDGENIWGAQLKGEKIKMARDIIRMMREPIECIDLTRVYSDSCGRREVIVELTGKKFVRLDPKKYLESIKDLLFFFKEMCNEEVVVDMRVSSLALIETISN